MADQPKALRLADFLDDQYDPSHNLEEAAAELRRLHDEVQMLNSAYESACKIIGEQDKKLAELEAANLKLAGAIDMIRETLNGGNVDDLLYIINTALAEHRGTA